MPTCGSCKLTHQSVDHIRSCYAAKYAPVASYPAPATATTLTLVTELITDTPLEELPVQTELVDEEAVESIEAPVSTKAAAVDPADLIAARYVVHAADGHLVFIEVERPTQGKWKGSTFVKQLVGAPGNWRKVRLFSFTYDPFLAEIAADPLASALAYSKNFTTCARCDAPLSDEVSRARGLGPDCVKHFAGV